ncbi:MAG: putative sugar nucleotidyl transferase [Candidatus Eisenbacteria bacterium]
MTTWVLFEDQSWAELRPLTWLRPPSELRFGADTTEARWRRLVGDDPLFVVCRDEVAALRAGRLGWGGLSGIAEDAVWVSDRLIPTAGTIDSLRSLPSGGSASLDGVAVAMRGSVDSARAGDLGACAAVSEELARCPVGVELESGDHLRHLGDLVRVQGTCLDADLGSLLGADGRGSLSPSGPIGDGSGPVVDGFGYARERIRIDETARVDHGAVLDAREGGIVLGAECVVLPGTYLKGPLIADRRCLFLGGTIGSGSSFGPVSRVRGEIETTVFLGYANKAHDGFVGHSYIGEWVNLGALTTTSDLKNDYGEVTLDVAGEMLKSGSNKIGTFFGDHAKTRIGALLNTGSIVGLGANVFGDVAVPERYIADFQWGTGADAVEYRIDKFLRVARTVLGRRGVPWTTEYERACHIAFAASESTRSRRLERA